MGFEIAICVALTVMFIAALNAHGSYVKMRFNHDEAKIKAQNERLRIENLNMELQIRQMELVENKTARLMKEKRQPKSLPAEESNSSHVKSTRRVSSDEQLRQP